MRQFSSDYEHNELMMQGKVAKIIDCSFVQICGLLIWHDGTKLVPIEFGDWRLYEKHIKRTVCHVIDTVEETVAFLVEQILCLTTHNFQWIRFVEYLTGFSVPDRNRRKLIINWEFQQMIVNDEIE